MKLGIKAVSAGMALALSLLTPALAARAETCPDKTAEASGKSDASTPAAVSNNGTGGTGWTGGTGGNSAGLESQKPPSAPTGQPEEAKGLDLKGVAPKNC